MSAKRITDISTALFPVEQRPVFMLDDTMQAELFDRTPAPTQQYTKIARFQAIVDIERKRPFAVVADNYRLVTNAEAIELGKQCFRKVFSQVTADGVEVFNIIMPKTRSFCHIDYIHNGAGFEPWKNDKWVPYLRVTNSYNRTKPLRFDLGFCRWICTNGMIFGGKSISFRYMHTHDAVGQTVEFKTTFGELQQLEKKFIEQVHNLQRYYVPAEVMLGLACKVFGIVATADDLRQPRRRDQLMGFRDQIRDLTDRYFKDMGPNGYAALNVLTDFASRPRVYISPEAMVDRLQKRSGDWVGTFLAAIEQKTFNFNDYLGESAKVAEVLAA